ncbi:MAG: ATP synthase F0 subunit B [Deltaproteobacteria bacterium]
MIRLAAQVFALTMLSAVPALAEGDGGHHEPQWSLTLFGFVNFAIFLFILKKFAWPLVVDYLQSRHLETLQALEAAATAKREAQEMKADFERKMASLESETAKAREELLAIARNEAAKVVAHAEATAERLKKDAVLLANQEVARAQRILQQESAQLIAKIAGELVSKDITDDDQKRFVDEFVKESAEAAS